MKITKTYHEYCIFLFSVTTSCCILCGGSPLNRQSQWINITGLSAPRGSREMRLRRLHSPGSVLAAGSTSGHERSLPEPSTVNTPAGTSSTHPPARHLGAAAPPPGRLTTLCQMEQNCTNLSRVAVSTEPGAKMCDVADHQLVFDLNC